MSLRLKVSPVAFEEVIEIQRHLEQDSPGIGIRFRAELEACWRLLLEFPKGTQVRYTCYRYAALSTLHYHVIYSVEDDLIIVHRVRHMHRRTLKRFFGK